jgi:hypothetical protein
LIGPFFISAVVLILVGRSFALCFGVTVLDEALEIFVGEVELDEVVFWWQGQLVFFFGEFF